jgi:hypothetical protein
MGQIMRSCLREPIPEIAEAAKLLDRAVSAHLAGDSESAKSLICAADLPPIRAWTESIWGSKSPYLQYRPVPHSPPTLPRNTRVVLRMPNRDEKQALHARDGYHCRFCGIPVIRKEVRKHMVVAYPEEARWGAKNAEQHAAFQAMWAQYDHILPHSRGGANDMSNMVVTCAPCNFGRMEFTLEEVGLADPRNREPAHSSWDGLERFRRSISSAAAACPA